MTVTHPWNPLHASLERGNSELHIEPDNDNAYQVLTDQHQEFLKSIRS